MDSGHLGGVRVENVVRSENRTDTDDRELVCVEESDVHALLENARKVRSLADGLVKFFDFLVRQSFVDVPPIRNLLRNGRCRLVGLGEVEIDDVDDDLLMLRQALANQMLQRLAD